MTKAYSIAALLLAACGAPKDTSAPEETTTETDTPTAPADPVWVRLAAGADEHSLAMLSPAVAVAAGVNGHAVTIYEVEGDVATPSPLTAYTDVSGEIDVAVAPSGARHLLHSRDAGGPGELIYGTDASGSWSFELLDRGAGDSGKGGWNALEVAADGTVYAAWESGNYAEGTAGAFFMGDWGGYELDVDLTLDDGGAPWIAGRDSSNVRVVRRDGSGGFDDFGLVDDLGGNTGFDVAIAVVAGQPAVAYATLMGDPKDVRVAVYDGSAWHTEVIASGDNVGGRPALAATPDGALHLLYADVQGGAWAYATRDPSGTWSSEAPAELTACAGAPTSESSAALATYEGHVWAGANGASGWCVGPLVP